MKLYCSHCGKEKKTAYVDGYHFGERLLEGIKFMLEIQDNKLTCTGVAEQDQEYFSTLNEDKWIDACNEYCEDVDIIKCIDCNQDVEVDRDDDYDELDKHVGLPIKATALSDIFGLEDTIDDNEE